MVERKQKRISTWRSVGGQRVKVRIAPGECRIVLDPFDTDLARYWCRSRWGWGWRRSNLGAALFASETEALQIARRIEELAPELKGRIHVEKVL